MGPRTATMDIKKQTNEQAGKSPPHSEPEEAIRCRGLIREGCGARPRRAMLPRRGAAGRAPSTSRRSLTGELKAENTGKNCPLMKSAFSGGVRELQGSAQPCTWGRGTPSSTQCRSWRFLITEPRAGQVSPLPAARSTCTPSAPPASFPGLWPWAPLPTTHRLISSQGLGRSPALVSLGPSSLLPPPPTGSGLLSPQQGNSPVGLPASRASPNAVLCTHPCLRAPVVPWPPACESRQLALPTRHHPA